MDVTFMVVVFIVVAETVPLTWRATVGLATPIPTFPLEYTKVDVLVGTPEF
jgi:hypothetical protein